MAPSPQFSGPTAREIAQMLNQQADSLASALLPAGKAYGGFWNVGSLHGEPGKSLKIHLSNPQKKGHWADYGCDENAPEGKGDMLKLVQMTVADGDIGKAIAWAKQWLSLDSIDPHQLERLRLRAARAAEKSEREELTVKEEKRRKAVGLWMHGSPGKGTPAQSYLEGRGIDFDRLGFWPGALRFHPQVWHSELGRKVPAMLASYSGHAGGQWATHITYLEHVAGAWHKLSGVEDAKKTWSPLYWGNFIVLCKGRFGKPMKDLPAGAEVHVSEGIEDGLTIAMLDPDRFVVAAGTLGNIGAMMLPPQAGDFVIIGQHDAAGSKADESFEKQIGKQQLQADSQATGDGDPRRIKIIWPDPLFKDFNDQINRKKIGTAHG